MPEPVYRAVTGHLALERGIGGYEAANQEQSKLDSFYTAFASLLNAQPDEIAFIENATRAWDMAVYAIPWKAGDRGTGTPVGICLQLPGIVATGTHVEHYH